MDFFFFIAMILLEKIDLQQSILVEIDVANR